jgi:predicted DCC family thiol-disulfide oxidoreductase YuxK
LTISRRDVDTFHSGDDVGVGGENGSTMSDDAAMLLYDGTCGFCAQSVQFVLRHERRRRTLRFAALQSERGIELRTRRPELEGVDSVIWVEPDAAGERVYVRSAAVFRVLRYLGGPWSVLARIGAIVPALIRDGVYDFVARHRHRIIRGGTACLLPTPEERARFEL